MPKWAIVIGSGVICSLMAVSSGLIVYVFTSLSSKVDKMGESFDGLRTQVVLLQAQVDTQSKFCRFTK